MSKVDLVELAEKLEMLADYWSYYIDKRNGKIISIDTNFLSMADSDEEQDIDSLMDWEKEDLLLANEIIFDESDSFVSLPSKFEINEYKIMKDFCYILKDDKIKNSLLNAISRKGAFRRFKDLIYRFNIEQHWYAYKKIAYLRIALEWCEDMKIPYYLDEKIKEQIFH